jgi:cell division protein FtsB
VAVAGLCALVVLVAGFPAASLLTQHHQLSAASTALSQLRRENARLTEQDQALNSKVEITRLARQDYQLVSPGQTLYDVLPSSASGASATAKDVAMGDPGNQALVDPADAPDMSPDPGLPQPGSVVPSSSLNDPSTSTAPGPTAHAAVSHSSSSFWGRVGDTLEFWR